MRLFLLTFFLCIFRSVFAQSPLPVHLKSGDYYPVNIENSEVQNNFNKDRFVILQFKTLPDVDLFFTQTGIRLLDYLPENSFYANLPTGFDFKKLPTTVSGILGITPAMKMDAVSWANRKVDVIKVVYFETADVHEVLRSIEQKGFNVLRYYENFQTIYIQAKNNFLPLLDIQEIYWAEPAYQKLETNNLLERTNHRASVIGDNSHPGKGLTGQGIKIGEWDGGDVGNHEDFNSRLTVVKKKFGVSNHATHVCGTMAGAGNIDPTAKGMAPKALIYSWDFYGDITAEMDTNYKKYGYTLTQNSYGYSPASDPCTLRGSYDLTSREIDMTVEKYPNLLHVFAAGNSRGNNCIANGFKTVLSGFQCAKNNMTVAAITYLDGDASFSSCGPAKDGRLKPEVSAVGVNVYSTLPGNIYQGGWSGTSMACPGASGTTALIYEYYKQKKGSLPDAHLAKNFMANSADDIGNAGPDFRYGFGRINAFRAVKLIDDKSFLTDSVKHNYTDTDTLQIPKGLFKIKIMLCWNDKAGAAGAKPSLVNDLDLTVKDSAGITYKPWVLDTVNCNNTALRGRDSLNNIEQVTIDNPGSGKLIIYVKGKRVTTSFQNYSLTWDMVKTGVSISYPNGLETFAPPSSGINTQIIRWDSYNLSGNAKLEFSTDSGKVWQTISAAVPVAQKYFSWANSSDTINTSKALVKITLGSYTDQSDTTFTIFKIPSTLVGVVCDSQVHFRWPKQKDAVAYKLWQLKIGEMQTIYSGTDTFFTVRPLNNGQTYWFSLSSISKKGGESQRRYAQSYVPNSTVKPPKITLNLNDTATCKNKTITLKTTVTGTATITSIWQRSTDAGKNWTDMTARLLDTFIITTPPFAQNGWRYRRVHLNACEGKVYTKIAKVEIDTAMPVFSIPKDTIGCAGATLRLKIYNIISVSKPNVSWVKNYNVVMDPFIYYKRSYEPFLEFINLQLTDKNWIVPIARNGCGQTLDKNGYTGINFIVAPKLTFSLLDFDTICLGKTYLLKGKITGGRADWYQYKWTGPGVNTIKDFIVIKPDTTSRYYFKLNDKGCSIDSLSDSIDVRVRPKLELFVSRDTTICAGTPTIISAVAKGGNRKYHFIWNNGLPQAAKQKVWPTKTTVYYITLTDSCSVAAPKDSIVVKVLPSLSLKLIAKSDTICIGQSTLLTAKVLGGKSGGYRFLWSTNQIDSVINVSPTVTKTYSINFKDGCTNQVINDSIKVNVRLPLSLKVLAPDTVCNNISFNISAKANGGFKANYKIVWNRFATPGNIKRDSTKTGIWEKAILTDNCTSLPAKDSIWVNVWQLPKVKAAPDTTLCFGQNHTFALKSSGGRNGTVKFWWEFNKALLANPVNLDPMVAGKFYYIAVIKDGCQFTNIDTTTITVLGKLSITPLIIQKCSPQDTLIIFKSSGGKPLNTQLNWLDGTKGFSKSFKEKKTKNYSLIISDGCSDTAMLTIPVVVDEFGNNDFKIELVFDKTVTLKAGVALQTVDWDFGDGSYSALKDTLIEKIFPDYDSYTICRKQTDRIGCITKICKDVNVINVMQNAWFTMKVFPNPNDGNFNLQFNKIPGKLKVEVFDILGKMVFSQSSLNYVGTKFNINIGNAASGLYLLRVSINDELVTRKIQVK